MPICRQQAPPLYWPRPHQASACYLESETGERAVPEVLEGDITRAFAPVERQRRTLEEEPVGP